MNSYPHQDLFPPSVLSFNSYCCNVIPAIGGGFLLEVHMEPCWDMYSEPQAIFFKISDNGDLEWRKCLWDPSFYEDPTYFNSIVSNGIDRYYGVGRDSGDPVYFYELDENCNVLTYRMLWNDSTDVRSINSIKLLDDGIIMAGRAYGVPPKSLILKTDLYGNILWHKEYQFWDNGSTGKSEFHSIITTSDSCFVAIGYGNIFGQYSKGLIYKVNSVGDTVWTVKSDYGYKSIVEYSSEKFYVLSAYYDYYLLGYDESGFLQEINIINNLGDGIQDSYALISTNDNDFILLFNTLYGEIHKVTPNGTNLWCRDYLDNSTDDSLIGVEEYKILETDNGDLVFCGTTEINYQDPELILIRTNPDGLDIDDPQSQAVNISTYPNPFSTTTTISFSGKVNPCELQQIKIYNIKGQLLRELLPVTPSLDRSVLVIWDGKDMDGNITAPGVYFYAIEFEDTAVVRKVVKLR